MKYVLNVQSRPDRLEQFQMSCPFQNVMVFYSVEASNPFLSFNRSMIAILNHFVNFTDHSTALVLEDDAIFSDDMNAWEVALSELPNDFDMLYLGANITDGVAQITEGNQPTRYSPHLARVKRAWTTHAILYSRAAAAEILRQCDPDICGMYDDWVSKNFLGNNNCYIVTPMVAFQRPGYSDLWSKNTDYAGAWQGSQDKLQAI